MTSNLCLTWGASSLLLEFPVLVCPFTLYSHSKRTLGRLMTGEFRLPYPPECFAFPVLGSSSNRMTKVNRPSPGGLRVQVWSKEQNLLDSSIRCLCRPTACCSPDRLLAFLLPRLDTNNERLRVGTLQILRHIVNSAGECPLCLQAGPLSMRVDAGHLWHGYCAIGPGRCPSFG